MVAHDVAFTVTEYVTTAVTRLSIALIAFAAVLVTSLFVDILHVGTIIFEREKLGFQTKVHKIPVSSKKEKKKKKRTKSSSKSQSSTRKKPERSTQSTVKGNPDKSERFLKSVPSDRGSIRNKNATTPDDLLAAPPVLAVPLVVQEREKKQANDDNSARPLTPGELNVRKPMAAGDADNLTALRIVQHVNTFQAKRRTPESVIDKNCLPEPPKNPAKPTPPGGVSNIDESKISDVKTPPTPVNPANVASSKPKTKDDKPESTLKSDLSAKMSSEAR